MASVPAGDPAAQAARADGAAEAGRCPGSLSEQTAGGAYSRSPLPRTAFRPRSIKQARLMTRFLASASDRASSSRSTLTEITFTPAPFLGRPGLRRAASSALAVGRPGYYTPLTMPTATAIRPRVVAAFSGRPRRPLAIMGHSGVGKTTLLRAIAAEADLDAIWYSAVDLIEQVVEALRGDRYEALRDAVVTDPRPLVVEHLEDLRRKPRTREELRQVLLVRADKGGATLLTSTCGRGHAEIVRWLNGWADVVSLD